MIEQQSEGEGSLFKLDRTKFGLTPFVRQVVKPWGFEIHFTPGNLPYMGKILHINPGKRLSLQIHDEKRESWYLLYGRVDMVLENPQGALEQLAMKPGFGYSVQIGQRHRLVGIEESEVLEVSTPEIGKTARLEDDYQRPDETEELRSKPNRGWVIKDGVEVETKGSDPYFVTRLPSREDLADFLRKQSSETPKFGSSVYYDLETGTFKRS